MSKYMVDGTDLTNIANAIRTKQGKTSPLSFPNEFISEIQRGSWQAETVKTLPNNQITIGARAVQTIGDIGTGIKNMGIRGLYATTSNNGLLVFFNRTSNGDSTPLYVYVYNNTDNAITIAKNAVTVYYQQYNPYL